MTMGPRFPLALLLLASVLLSVAEGQATVDSGLDESMQKAIVSRHNQYRSQLKATNMLAMRWSKELEEEAAKWVDKCNFIHQENSTWGGNIYRSEFDRAKLNIIFTGLNSWNLERSFVGANSCCDAIINTTLCCNYQQMVWAQTRDVGCALKKCDELTAPDNKFLNAWFMACYYKPRGNVAGFKAFGTEGVPCSACPFTYDQCEKYLCHPSLFCQGNL